MQRRTFFGTFAAAIAALFSSSKVKEKSKELAKEDIEKLRACIKHQQDLLDNVYQDLDVIINGNPKTAKPLGIITANEYREFKK